MSFYSVVYTQKGVEVENERAKDVRGVIKQFHSCLNSPNLLPMQAYRSSSLGAYPVLWVNQVVALMISHNYDPVPAAINRAFTTFDHFKDKPVFDSYKKVAYSYLCQVTYFIVNFTEIEQKTIELVLPKSLVEAGPQKAPPYQIQTLSFERD